MRKAVIIIVAVSLLSGLAVGCAGTDYEPPYDVTWLSPGKVEVDNYYPGGRAEWELTIHNGNIDDVTDAKLVTTEDDETSFSVKLKYRLYGEASTVKIVSDADESPVPVSYNPDTQELTIKDCLPGTTRKLEFTYPRETEYSVSVRLPDNVWEGYQNAPENYRNWIKISNSRPVLIPGETVNVMIALEAPKSVTIDPDKWEFWVTLVEAGPASMISIELCSRWLVDMKKS